MEPDWLRHAQNRAVVVLLWMKAIAGCSNAAGRVVADALASLTAVANSAVLTPPVPTEPGSRGADPSPYRCGAVPAAGAPAPPAGSGRRVPLPYRDTPEASMLAAQGVGGPHAPQGLVDLIRYDPHLTLPVRTALHSLCVSLVRHTRFRAALGCAYGVAYPELSLRWARGQGTERSSALTHLAVQLITVPSVVTALIDSGDFPAALTGQMWRSLAVHAVVLPRRIQENILAGLDPSWPQEYGMFSLPKPDSDLGLGLVPEATSESPPSIDPAPVVNTGLACRPVAHGRYLHSASVLLYTVRVPGAANAILRDTPALTALMHALRVMQGMAPQTRQVGEHVAYESDDFTRAFAMGLNVDHTVSFLLNHVTSCAALPLPLQQVQVEMGASGSGASAPLSVALMRPLAASDASRILHTATAHVLEWAMARGISDEAVSFTPLWQLRRAQAPAGTTSAGEDEPAPFSFREHLTLPYQVLGKPASLHFPAHRFVGSLAATLARAGCAVLLPPPGTPLPAMTDLTAIPACATATAIAGCSASSAVSAPAQPVFVGFDAPRAAVFSDVYTSTADGTLERLCQISVILKIHHGRHGRFQLPQSAYLDPCRMVTFYQPEINAATLLEHPLRALALAGQFHARFWVRNGSNIQQQLTLYTQNGYYDRDILAVQTVAAALADPETALSHLLLKFGGVRPMFEVCFRWKADGAGITRDDVGYKTAASLFKLLPGALRVLVHIATELPPLALPQWAGSPAEVTPTTAPLSFVCPPDVPLQPAQTDEDRPEGLAYDTPPAVPGDDEPAFKRQRSGSGPSSPSAASPAAAMDTDAEASNAVSASVAAASAPGADASLPGVPAGWAVISSPEQITDATHVMQLRREIVHALAQGPSTRSKLAKVAAEAVYEHKSRVDEDGLSAVLASVADYRQPSGVMDTGVYVLRDSVLMSEFDPLFIHLKAEKRADAVEVWANRRKATATGGEGGAPPTLIKVLEAARPLAPRPPPSLPSFLPARRILHTAAFAHIVRMVLADALTPRPAPVPGSPAPSTAVPTGSDEAVSAALHALTVALHTLPRLDPEAPAEGASAPPQTLTSAFLAALASREASLSHLSHAQGSPGSSPESVPSTLTPRPSVIELLYSLYKSESASAMTPVNREGAAWLLQTLRAAHPFTASETQRVLGADIESAAAAEAAAGEAVRKAELEARKKAAQARAMASMAQRQASALSRYATTAGAGAGEEGEGDVDMGGEGGAASPSTDDAAAAPAMPPVVKALLSGLLGALPGSAQPILTPHDIPVPVATSSSGSGSDGGLIPLPSCILCNSSHEDEAATSAEQGPLSFIALAEGSAVLHACSPEEAEKRVQRGLQLGWLPEEAVPAEVAAKARATRAAAPKRAATQHPYPPVLSPAAPPTPASPSLGATATASASKKESASVSGSLCYPLTPFSGEHGLAVSFCGHAAHTGCIAKHIDKARTDPGPTGLGPDGHYLRGTDGEFQCPLCRTLSNTLVPCEVAGSWPLADLLAGARASSSGGAGGGVYPLQQRLEGAAASAHASLISALTEQARAAGLLTGEASGAAADASDGLSTLHRRVLVRAGLTVDLSSSLTAIEGAGAPSALATVKTRLAALNDLRRQIGLQPFETEAMDATGERKGKRPGLGALARTLSNRAFQALVRPNLTDAAKDVAGGVGAHTTAKDAEARWRHVDHTPLEDALTLLTAVGTTLAQADAEVATGGMTQAWTRGGEPRDKVGAGSLDGSDSALAQLARHTSGVGLASVARHRLPLSALIGLARHAACLLAHPELSPLFQQEAERVVDGSTPSDSAAVAKLLQPGAAWAPPGSRFAAGRSASSALDDVAALAERALAAFSPGTDEDDNTGGIWPDEEGDVAEGDVFGAVDGFGEDEGEDDDEGDEGSESDEEGDWDEEDDGYNEADEEEDDDGGDEDGSVSSEDEEHLSSLVGNAHPAGPSAPPAAAVSPAPAGNPAAAAGAAAAAAGGGDITDDDSDVPPPLLNSHGGHIGAPAVPAAGGAGLPLPGQPAQAPPAAAAGGIASAATGVDTDSGSDSDNDDLPALLGAAPYTALNQVLQQPQPGAPAAGANSPALPAMPPLQPPPPLPQPPAPAAAAPPAAASGALPPLPGPGDDSDQDEPMAGGTGAGGGAPAPPPGPVQPLASFTAFAAAGGVPTFMLPGGLTLQAGVVPINLGGGGSPITMPSFGSIATMMGQLFNGAMGGGGGAGAGLGPGGNIIANGGAAGLGALSVALTNALMGPAFGGQQQPQGQGQAEQAQVGGGAGAAENEFGGPNFLTASGAFDGNATLQSLFPGIPLDGAGLNDPLASSMLGLGQPGAANPLQILIDGQAGSRAGASASPATAAAARFQPPPVDEAAAGSASQWFPRVLPGLYVPELHHPIRSVIADLLTTGAADCPRAGGAPGPGALLQGGRDLVASFLRRAPAPDALSGEPPVAAHDCDALRAARLQAVLTSLKLDRVDPLRLLIAGVAVAPSLAHAVHMACLCYVVALRADDERRPDIAGAERYVRHACLLLAALAPVAPSAAVPPAAAAASSPLVAGFLAAISGPISASLACAAAHKAGIITQEDPKVAARATAQHACGCGVCSPDLLHLARLVCHDSLLPDSNMADFVFKRVLAAHSGALRLIGASPYAGSQLTGQAAATGDEAVPLSRSDVSITPASLIDLPRSFDTLYAALSGARCGKCGKKPANPYLCLLCGGLVCAGDDCCRTGGVGEASRHASSCGGGTGVYFNTSSTQIMLFRGGHAIEYPSPYTDAHGEPDHGLKRGKPLFLNARRYGALTELWARGGVGREVAHQRSIAERVYRANVF